MIGFSEYKWFWSPSPTHISKTIVIIKNRNVYLLKETRFDYWLGKVFCGRKKSLVSLVYNGLIGLINKLFKGNVSMLHRKKKSLVCENRHRHKVLLLKETWGLSRNAESGSLILMIKSKSAFSPDTHRIWMHVKVWEAPSREWQEIKGTC